MELGARRGCPQTIVSDNGKGKALRTRLLEFNRQIIRQ